MQNRRASLLMAVASALFLLGGLRDMFLPGFLTISSWRPDGTVSLAIGMLFLIFAVRLSKRTPV